MFSPKLAVFIATFAIFHVYPDITILFIFSRSSHDSFVKLKSLFIEILDTLISVVSCAVQEAVSLFVEVLVVQHIFLDACIVYGAISYILIFVLSITDFASVWFGHHVAFIESLRQRCWTCDKKHILGVHSFIDVSSDFLDHGKGCWVVLSHYDESG